MRWMPLVLAGVLLAGCQTPYADFYQAAPAGSIQPIAFVGAPEIRSGSGDPQRDANEMYSRGYAVVGSASFNGPLQSASAVLQQAKKVGARYVVASSSYARTV